MGMLDDILNDVGAEAGRLGRQGSAELAAAIFGGNAYVQYGAGQNPVEPQREHEQAAEAPEVEPPVGPELDRGMDR
ncbi:MAG TPA: hypothetical protein VG826_33010 [Pirellulales bacterium]|nr:hypothetical protein [Pirellulales bacterium]